MHLIDSHCHLDFSVFDADRGALIERCKQKNIHQFIVPGVTCATWPRLTDMVNEHTECLPAYGLHPYFLAEHVPQHLEVLEDVLEKYRPIAVGEIGLDFYLKDLDKEKQTILFHAQLALARQFELPVILHVRKAHDAVIVALKKTKVKGGIVHAFNGSFQQAKQYTSLGFRLGFGGALTYDRARHLRRLAQELPLESIVLETDSPDMRPASDISHRNTPLTIIPVLNTLSDLRSESKTLIKKQTSVNVKALFDLI